MTSELQPKRDGVIRSSAWLGKPYYDADGITIYHGDCRQIVPLLGRFDLLLTDPPYGIGRDGSKQTTSRHGGRKAYDFLGWDAGRPESWLVEMLLDQTEKHIIWGGNYFVDSLAPTMKWLVWDKGQRICQSDGELAWTSLEGALRICTLNRVELMGDVAQHPTQKPEKLMRWCIEQAGEVKTILDPFAGSGTTGRAAKASAKPQCSSSARNASVRSLRNACPSACSGCPTTQAHRAPTYDQ